MPELVPLKKKIQTTRDFLEGMRAQLALALPRHLTPDRLVRVVLTECLASVQRSKPGQSLLECTKESFAGAVLEIASLGLEPGVLGQAHLIPLRNNKRGTIECHLWLGYRGLLDLMRRSGEILTINPVIVHAKDKFHLEQGTRPGIVHVPFSPPLLEDADGIPLPREGSGEAIAYYAVATLRGGGVQFTVMTRAEVEAHRDQFARSHEGPWSTHFDAMALKTVLKRLGKYLPVSVELQRGMKHDDNLEAGLPSELGLEWLGDRLAADAPVEGLERLQPAEDAAAEGTTGTPAGGRLEAALAGRRKKLTPEVEPVDSATGA